MDVVWKIIGLVVCYAFIQYLDWSWNLRPKD